MTYEEAREFIQQSNQYGIVPGLETITELLSRLGNPQEQLKIIHVAGTNGKGSTCAFLTAILNAAGYRVGRYISPSVFSYRERIQISRLITGRAFTPDKADNTDSLTDKGTAEVVEASAVKENHVDLETSVVKENNVDLEASVVKENHVNLEASVDMEVSRGAGDIAAKDDYVDMEDSGDKNSWKVRKTASDFTTQELSTEYITREGVCRTIEIIKPVCESMVKDGYSHPTSFELETAMTFLYLLREKVDFVVLEVGLGGRLDATNVIKKPVISVITSISMDHMQFLGDTLEKIASEKAGIIKEGCPVVTCEQEPEVIRVIKDKATAQGSGLRLADSSSVTDINYSLEGTQFLLPHNGSLYGPDKAYRIRLLGRNQIKNAVLALEAARVIQQAGFAVNEEAIQDGLSLASWSGRFEVVSRNPYLVIDGAHNEDAAKTLRDSIEIYFTNRRLVYMIGVLADKDYRSILKITAPLAAAIITLTPDNSRALSSDRLALEAGKYCDRVMDAGNVNQALKLAFEEAGEEDVIIVFGSLSFLGDVVSSLTLRKDEDI